MLVNVAITVLTTVLCAARAVMGPACEGHYGVSVPPQLISRYSTGRGPRHARVWEHLPVEWGKWGGGGPRPVTSWMTHADVSGGGVNGSMLWKKYVQKRWQRGLLGARLILRVVFLSEAAGEGKKLDSPPVVPSRSRWWTAFDICSTFNPPVTLGSIWPRSMFNPPVTFIFTDIFYPRGQFDPSN